MSTRTTVRKRWRLAPVGVAIPMMFIAACGGSGGSTGSESGSSSPVLIASPVDLTGANASLGASLKAGLDAAVKQINGAGGILGRQVKVDYKDTRSEAQTAASTLTQMLASKDYAAVIPSAGGSTTLPLLQVIKSKHVFATLTGSEPDIGNPSVYPTVFDVAPPFAEQGHAVGCALATFHPAKVGIIQLDDPFNEAVADEAAKVVEASGAQVVDHEKYGLNDTNVIPVVQKLLAKKPDLILLSTFYFKVGPVFSALQNLKNEVPVVGDTGTSSGPPSSVLSSGQSIPAGMASVAPASDVRVGNAFSAQQQQVIGLLKSSGVSDFKSGLSQYLYNYDGLQLVKFAAEKAGSTDTDAMIKALEGLKDDPEATGGLYESMPPFSSTNHEYEDLKYYMTDYAEQFKDGTFAAKGEALNC